MVTLDVEPLQERAPKLTQNRHRLQRRSLPATAEGRPSTWTRAETRLLATFIVVSIVAYLTMTLASVPLSGHDAKLHLDWIEQFVAMRRSGMNYPRWLNLSFGGFGADTFYFYPPLTYVLASWIDVVVPHLDPTRLYHLLHLFSTVGTVIGCSAYLRFHSFSKREALIGAFIFALGPYHIWNIFMRNALAEQMAFMWVAPLLLAIDWALTGKLSLRVPAAILFATSAAGIVLTNVPSTIVLALCATAYAVAQVLVQGRPLRVRRLLPLVAGSAIGALVTAWYILPAIAFKRYMPIEQLFDAHRVFGTWFFVLEDAFNSRIVRTGLHVVVTLTLAASILFVPWYVRFVRQSISQNVKNNGVYAGWLAYGAIAIALQIPRISQSVWDHFVPLQLVQFTWRFTFALALFPAVIGVTTLRVGASRATRMLLLFYVAFMSFWYVRYAYIVFIYPTPPPMVTAGRIGAPEHLPRTASARYHDIQATYAATHFDAPAAWLNHYHLSSASYVGTHDTIYPVALGNTERRFHVSLASADSVEFHLFYWPQWKLYHAVTGREIETAPGYHGRMTALLGPGDYDLTLRLETSPVERAGKWISVLGLMLLGSMMVYAASFWRIHQSYVAKDS